MFQVVVAHVIKKLCDGVALGVCGTWGCGTWGCGTWGVWHLGVWHLGVWHLGVWHLGVWHLGVWHLGCVFTEIPLTIPYSGSLYI